MKTAGKDFCLTQKAAQKAAKNNFIKPLMSHDLARQLLSMPNLFVSNHEHGELLEGARVDRVASNIGLIKAIVLDF